jgi:hypothetical protein
MDVVGWKCQEHISQAQRAQRKHIQHLCVSASPRQALEVSIAEGDVAAARFGDAQ